MPVLIAGDLALDQVKTPLLVQNDQLGGSAAYAAVAAKFFSPVHLVGVVGEDFPIAHTEMLAGRGIDLAGLVHAQGKTFRWSAAYEWDLNVRTTLHRESHVTEGFRPLLSPAYRETGVVLLTNSAPDLQIHVLDQLVRRRFVVVDTMDHWIQTRPELFNEVLARADLAVLNESEARMLTKETSLIRAGARIREMGPGYAVIKKGEHGALLFGPGGQLFICPACPLEEVADPTGAGDTFAGALAGYLAADDSAHITFSRLQKGVVLGSVLASFCVESFSMTRMLPLTREEILARYKRFHEISDFEEVMDTSHDSSPAVTPARP